MTAVLRRTLIVVVAVVVLASLGWVAWLVAPVAAGAATTSWATCTPGATEYLGAYRIFNNAWQESRQCVTSTGLNITITSDAVARVNVVAYPSVRFGAFYTDWDRVSGLPVRVTRVRGLTLHVASRGTAGGQWLSDADVWFRPRADWTLHGTFELVVVNRASSPAPRYWPAVRIRGVWFRWSEWVTRDRTTGLRWPILVFRQIHQTTTATIPVGSFVWHAMRWGFLPGSAWLGSVAYGSELWSGGRGLTDSMTVTGVTS